MAGPKLAANAARTRTLMLGVMLIGAMAALLAASALPFPPVVIGLVVAGVAQLVLAYYAHGDALIGPLFFYDLVRLARRGRSTGLRILYGGLLLVVLAWVYAYHFSPEAALRFSDSGASVSLRQQARFAQTFATTLLLVQNLAVLALTPAYLAGAIAEETEMQTLPLLFTTQLTNREIVLGKMLGRLTHIGGVLLVGLPVVSLAQLWGGVDIRMLLAGFASTALTLLSVGAMCLLCSVLARTVLSATLAAYALTAALGFGCLCQGGGFAFSPVSFIVALDERLARGDDVSGSGATPFPFGGTALEMLIAFAIVQGTILLFGLGWAISQLRPGEPVRRTQPLRHPETEPIPPTWERGYYLDPVALYRASPPVGVNGLFWKEVLKGTGSVTPNFRRETKVAAVVGAAIIVGIWVFAGLAWLAFAPQGSAFDWPAVIDSAFNPIVRWGSISTFTLLCLIAGFRAAGSVSRERDRRTLDGLLVLPLTPAEILRAKWLGSILRSRYVVYGLGVLWLVGIGTGALHPLMAPLLAFSMAAQLGLVTSLGVCMSVVNRNTTAAQLSMALILLMFFAGAWLIWLWLDAPPDNDFKFVETFFFIGLNPWRSGYALAAPLSWPPELLQPAEGMGLIATWAGGVVFALHAVWFWRRAIARFGRKSGGRSSCRNRATTPECA
jgi:ABC-type transport system involved in multi-copper enzyme maturation permease subunit